ncbi:hypothetical protein GH742_13605 [Legionella sp. MW5194]|uniref:hypothetical protein n=1 Tax=Legionella sp. MW5194 TaxID=2662448 RepID=UPI00193CC301|nr:hypothetical protein [Legionella sp. MW5194]QRN04812.1 hypothetical protein GH742_13605 [Legionella sp. MW5194]
MPDSLHRAANYLAARKACQYARRFVVKGATQGINNTYTSQQRVSLESAVSDLRECSLAKDPYNLETDLSIHIFYKVTELCKKFSLGNCFELSLLSLEYLVMNEPDVRAEVFTLSGGDHTFLVVGRNPASQIHSPETWGKNAFFCDPWANKVYPAHKYPIHLRNHYSRTYLNNTTEDFLNHTEKFDKTRHVFKRMDTLTTTYLRTADAPLHKQQIKSLFEQRATSIQHAIQSLIAALQPIAQSIEEEYGAQDAKHVMIKRLVSELTVQIDCITAIMKQGIDFKESYLNVRMTLQDYLKEHTIRYWKSMILSESDRNTLFTYHYPLSPKTIWMQFFQIPPKTAAKVMDRLEKAQDELQAHLHPF